MGYFSKDGKKGNLSVKNDISPRQPKPKMTKAQMADASKLPRPKK